MKLCSPAVIEHIRGTNTFTWTFVIKLDCFPHLEAAGFWYQWDLVWWGVGTDNSPLDGSAGAFWRCRAVLRLQWKWCNKFCSEARRPPPPRTFSSVEYPAEHGKPVAMFIQLLRVRRAQVFLSEPAQGTTDKSKRIVSRCKQAEQKWSCPDRHRDGGPRPRSCTQTQKSSEDSNKWIKKTNRRPEKYLRSREVTLLNFFLL